MNIIYIPFCRIFVLINFPETYKQFPINWLVNLKINIDLSPRRIQTSKQHQDKLKKISMHRIY